MLGNLAGKWEPTENEIEEKLSYFKVLKNFNPFPEAFVAIIF